MEVTGLVIVTAIVTFLSAVSAAEEVAQAPDYAKQCAPDIIALLPCMPAVKGSGSPPSPQCCSAIAELLKDDPICLCYVAADAAQRNDPNINATVALQLPALCNLKADVHKCDGFPGFPGTGMAPMPGMGPGGEMPPMPWMPGMPPMIPGGDAPPAPTPSSTSMTIPKLYHLAVALVLPAILTYVA
ncbi:protein YLS3-like [Selaginella moellendorffii]|uniref:protein YLS3-like n=1 Tax=Selaginella moellendorffii TaxID=88036 RepID=UPI000D1CEAD7|nr:protein YLS3-like [Selaginella moellendorffii]|eukprot:XP_024518263.1 protein YLS3-like [Selaginella moellendorffii]